MAAAGVQGVLQSRWVTVSVGVSQGIAAMVTVVSHS